MSSEKRNKLSEIFKLAWQFVKRNGYKLSEALKCAWLNMKLKAEMKKRIVKFYFQKIDGSLREAYGTTNPETIPATTGTRKPADTVQTYFDTEKQDKIKEVLGNEYLENNILQSLNKYFENSDNDRIYSDIEPDGYVTDYGNKYPLLRINDVANSDAMLEFAVMGQMYDVLNLSYVGRMKG